LSHCQKHLSDISISLAIGFLFMVMHFLNPEIDLMKTGPTLFFAGALLAILYLYYRTIWLPLGVHFGNNFLGSVAGTWWDGDAFVGKDGYLTAVILALLYLVFAVLSWRRSKRHEDRVNLS
jgi:membrane protease YdiL (CAAX protease family)